MNEVPTNRPARSFLGLSIFATIWNAIGVLTYLMQVTMSDKALAAMSPEDRALYAAIPAWVTGAYAIAVFGGLLGSIGLLLRKRWSVPVFAVSLIGIVVQMFYSLFLSDMVAVKGAGSIVMPVLIIAVGVFLLWYARSAAAKGWLS